MTTKAQIVVSAVDKASATMLRIRAEMRAMTQPMRDIKASFGRFTEASGLKQVGRDMQKIARTARSVASGVTSIVAPMGALIGVGTVAGLGELMRRWASLGWSVSRTAQTIGVAPTQLMALQGAAKLAGLSADDMTSSLGALGTTLQDAVYGRNQQAMYALNQLGITIHRTASGAVDTTRALSDLSAVIQRYNGQPQVQQRIADQFGIGSLLPLLRQGPAAIRRFEAEARRLGYTLGGDALNRSEALGQSFVRLELSLDGLRNSIADSLYPVMQPMLNSFVQWISANRVLVGQKVSEWVGAVVRWVKSVNWSQVWSDIRQTAEQILAIARGINSAVQALGGWKSTLELAFGAWAIGKLGMFTLAVLRTAKAFGTLRAEAGAAGVASGAGLWWKGGLVGLAGFGGYELGKHVVSPAIDHAVSAATGRPNSLGGAIYDWLHPNGDSRTKAKTLFPYLEKHYGLPPGLLDSVWRQESDRGRNMWSPVGAVGDFQFMPSTAKAYGVKNPMDFTQSAQGAARMYGDLLRQYRGDTSKALAAYNWGSGNLDRDISAHGADWLTYAPRETQNYVRDILGRMQGGPQKVQVEVSMKNMPPGTRVEARDDKGNSVPARVAYNMVGQPW